MFANPPWDDTVTLPRLTTPVPGPRSLRIHADEQQYQAAGTSAGSQWAQLAVVDGRGAMVRDADGNYLLDACSGTVVMNIGHGSVRIAEALAEQARHLTHFYDYPSPVRVEFLRALAATLPAGLGTFQLLNSGTEAVETSLRIVRSATGRSEVVAFHDAFHGRSLGAMSLTTGAGRHGLGPLLPGVLHVPTPHRFPGPGSAADRADACADHLEMVLDQVLTAAPAAVYIEPVQGAGGTLPVPARFLQRLRELCDRTGALLVFDEILTGAGRTGRMWAFEHSGVVPDLLLSGKGLGGGYPVGLVAGSPEVMNAGPVALPTHNSSTFGGGQLACAAGLASLAELADGRLVENAAAVGTHLLDRLRVELAGSPAVRDVRGLGLLIGIELAPGPWDAVDGGLPRRLLRELLTRGIVISSGGNVVRITPPLCLTIEQADAIAEAVVSSVAAAVCPEGAASPA